jgi:type IV pilus assembly protein PilA
MTKHKAVTETITHENYCPHCGQQQTSKSKYCGTCGHSLTEAALPAVAYQSSGTHPVVWALLAVVIGLFGIGVLAILASIVIVAINPTKQLADARNAQRQADINTILNAVYQYEIDNDGQFPSSHAATLSSIPIEICNTGKQVEITATSPVDCSGLIDLSELVNNEVYLVAMPADPQAANSVSTGYTISKEYDGTLTIAAENAENGTSLAVNR